MLIQWWCPNSLSPSLLIAGLDFETLFPLSVLSPVVKADVEVYPSLSISLIPLDQRVVYA